MALRLPSSSDSSAPCSSSPPPPSPAVDSYELTDLALTPTPGPHPQQLLPSAFYIAHSSSLLLSLALLPLLDVASSSCVCRGWYSLITRDSQQLAWRWQRKEERRKFNDAAEEEQPKSPNTVIAPPPAVIAAAAAAHLPFGDHDPAVEACRAAWLRATARAYFLQQGVGLLPQAEQAMESPVHVADAGLLRPMHAWPSASSGSSLPPSTPLLFHLRSLRLSMHSDFTRVYGRFVAALPHLTRLHLDVTSMWEMDADAMREAFAALGGKRQPLLSMELLLMDINGLDGMSAGQRSRFNKLAAASSPAAAAASFAAAAAAAGSPAHLSANYSILIACLPALTGLRSLTLTGLSDSLDSDHLSWLGNAASNESCFPRLMQLVLPSSLSKSARRIFSIRKMLPRLRELVWPGWTDLLDLNLMIGTAAREARIDAANTEARNKASRDALQPPDRRDSASSSSSSSSASSNYIPPPLRLPIPPLTCFALEGNLSEAHLQLLAESLAPSLRKLVVVDTQTRPHATLASLKALGPFTTGRAPRADEMQGGNESEPDPYRDESTSSSSGGDIGTGGVEDLTLRCASWTHVCLSSLQDVGVWPRLRRLTLGSSGVPGAADAPVQHSLSISNSSFHPGRFMQNLGIENRLVELTLSDVPLTGLGSIAHGGLAHSSQLTSLTLRRVTAFNSRSLASLQHLRRNLRHLTLDEVQNVKVEQLDALLPPQPQPQPSPASAASSSSSAPPPPLFAPPGGLHPVAPGDEVPLGLQLDTFHYSLYHIRDGLSGTAALAYRSEVSEWMRKRPTKGPRSTLTHPMQSAPFATDEERALSLPQQPTNRTINAWTEHYLRIWINKMQLPTSPAASAAASAASSSSSSSSASSSVPSPPRMHVFLRNLPASDWSPPQEWRELI